VPVWDASRQALLSRHRGQALQRLTPATGAVKRWTCPSASLLRAREKGGLIVAFASGIAFHDLDDRHTDWIARPDPVPTNRFNEGKCDRKRAVLGRHMDDRLADHSSSLYRVDPDRSVTKVLGGIGISNSIVWSLDDRAFYFADTLDGVIDRFDYDAAAGTIANRRRIVDLGGTGISPDGSTIDTEGYLWTAQWDGWRVARYAPTGGSTAS
jgi:sugar lactone lactonase YvrE